MLRKSLIMFSCAVGLLGQSGTSLAALRAAAAPTAVKKKVVSSFDVKGPVVKCHQWGFMQLELKGTKTVVTNGSAAPVVTIQITSVSWPIYPDHTPKSKYINAQALPLLLSETMTLQASSGTKLENISGATHTTVSWRETLQAALALALKP